ncbi:MAG: tetratricopeptide repeat protein [Burkholderiales bacterium]|nr:tetratricopeptide repeat protein [Burkholderiales bacterium]
MKRLFAKGLSVVVLTILSGAVHAILTEENNGLGSDESFAIARQAIEREDWPAAIEALRTVADNQPRNADAHAWLGYALRRSGRYDEALASYDRALRISPRHRAAHEYLGEAYLALGRRDDAEAQWRELQRICGLASCEEVQQLRGAIDRFDTSIRR